MDKDPMKLKRMRHLLYSVVPIVAAVFCACSSGSDTAAVLDQGQQAAVIQTKMTLSIPATLDVRNLAVGASSTVLFGDRSQLLKGTTGYADSSSTGTVNADYLHNVKVGSITATGPVRVFENSTVDGSITSGQTITFGKDNSPDPKIEGGPVTVTGPIRPNTPLSVQQLSWTVPFNQVTGYPPAITSNTTLEPGGYGGLNVQKGTVTLKAGSYYIDSLTFEKDATISVNTSRGPVQVYIRTAFNDRGKWSASEPEKVLLGYLGTNLLALETPFAGTVVAPNARVRLAVRGTPHTGSVFAKEVELDPDVTLTFKPFSGWKTLVPGLITDAGADGGRDSGVPDAGGQGPGSGGSVNPGGDAAGSGAVAADGSAGGAGGADGGLDGSPGTPGGHTIVPTETTSSGLAPGASGEGSFRVTDNGQATFEIPIWMGVKQGGNPGFVIDQLQ